MISRLSRLTGMTPKTLWAIVRSGLWTGFGAGLAVGHPHVFWAVFLGGLVAGMHFAVLVVVLKGR